ncbi:MAG: hypothetical protein D6713_01205, partial [Deltaproteobacteria bacterium]
LLERPLPARFARRFVEGMLGLLGPLPEEVSAEDFPKQSFVPQGRLGNLIKVPLGVNRRSGRYSRFLNPDGSPVENPFLFLNSAPLVNPDLLVEAAGKARVVRAFPVKEKWEDDEDPLENVFDGTAFSGSAETSPGPEYDFESDPQVARLLDRCPVLAELVNRVLTFRELSQEERIVLTHTLGHLERGPEAVNHLLSKCPGVAPNQFLKSPLRGNPISCPKIRARVPHITEGVRCNCEFNPSRMMYPTPLLHIEGEYSAPPTVLEVNTMGLTRTVEEYMRLKKELNAIEMALEKLEARIFAAFEEAGVTEMRTPFGLLRVEEEEGKRRLRLVL